MAPPRKLTASGRDRGTPLADFLAERLGLTRAAAASLILRGSVYVGRARVEDPERPLAAGERVAAYTAPTPAPEAASLAAEPAGTAGGAGAPGAEAGTAGVGAGSRGAGEGAASAASAASAEPGAPPSPLPASAAPAPAFTPRAASTPAVPAATTAVVFAVRAREPGAHGAAPAAAAHMSATPAGKGAVALAAEPGAGTALLVVHEDGDALVLDKPAGVPSQAARDTAAGALDRLVARRDPDARLLHRLDRDASGLVLFTRTAAARRRFAALLEDGSLERRYTAVVWGHIAADAGVLDRPIGPDPRDRRRMSAVAHGRPALTRYRVMLRGRAPGGAPTTLVELQLATGRTHQIRVHLAAAGHPLCGDRLYGPASPPEPVPRLCLHATRLAWPGAAPVESPAPALFAALVAP